MQLKAYIGMLTGLFLAALAGSTVAQTPAVVYETSLSGYALPQARDVAVADDGSAYFIGSTYTDGTHIDVLVVKLDPEGNQVWTHSIAGTGHNYAADLALDSAGDLWVTGWTDSPEFPTVNAMDATLTGFRDIFLARFSGSDGTLLYSTFIGGDYTDTGSGIAINESDEIYLTGIAGSTDFPTTPDAYQPGPSFPLYSFHDAFVMKLAPGGNAILYSTYFGGTYDDWGDRIALDGAGNIIIAGRSKADDFPLANEIDATRRSLFVSKFSADGSTLLFSTFIGGSEGETLGDMVANAGGDVYLTGSTQSPDYPTTAGAYQEDFAGAINGCEIPFGGTFNCEDFFASKLSTTGGGIIWSTFIGGTTVDEARGIAVDDAGNAYVVGHTVSSDFPMGDAESGADITVCRLSGNGSTLDYVHTIASGSANRGKGIAVGDNGAVYFTGSVGVPANIYASKLQGAASTLTGTTDTPPGLALGRNVPNPFNPTTTITYTLPEDASASDVSLSVFDVNGRLVTELVNEQKSAGPHSVVWDGRNRRGAEVSTGVYFYRLRWGGRSIARRMVLVK